MLCFDAKPECWAFPAVIETSALPLFDNLFKRGTFVPHVSDEETAIPQGCLTNGNSLAHDSFRMLERRAKILASLHGRHPTGIYRLAYAHLVQPVQLILTQLEINGCKVIL